jgi:hypothetical protein
MTTQRSLTGRFVRSAAHPIPTNLEAMPDDTDNECSTKQALEAIPIRPCLSTSDASPLQSISAANTMMRIRKSHPGSPRFLVATSVHVDFADGDIEAFRQI